MTTALEDLLERINSVPSGTTHITVESVKELINSLMQKERETHESMFAQPTVPTYRHPEEFNQLFPTHPTNQ